MMMLGLLSVSTSPLITVESAVRDNAEPNTIVESLILMSNRIVSGPALEFAKETAYRKVPGDPSSRRLVTRCGSIGMAGMGAENADECPKLS